jgi:nucleoside-diphosphate-sugar epimerase
LASFEHNPILLQALGTSANDKGKFVRILVTGASGFVGKHLCQILETGGHEVVRADRVQHLVTDVVVGDIGPATDWWPAVVQRPDVVVHLAARVHVMYETAADPLVEFRRINVEGTLNLARQAADAGIRRFVYLSSIKVNGEVTAPERPFRADDMPAPQDVYAISKHEAETGLLALAHTTGLEVVIIRPPIVYGPGVKGNFASLLSWVQRGYPLPLGVVRNARSLIALENLVDFIALCTDQERSPHAANEIFLISDGEDVSTTELLKKVAEAYGCVACLIPLPTLMLRLMARMMGKSSMADRLLGYLLVDSSKACNLLGWHPVVTMDGQLRKMAKHAASV